MLHVACSVVQCRCINVHMCIWEAASAWSSATLHKSHLSCGRSDLCGAAPCNGVTRVGRHRSACATNSDCAQTSMSFAQKGHSTMVETRAPHDCDLRTGPKPWPVTECTRAGSVDARLPLQSDAMGGRGLFLTIGVTQGATSALYSASTGTEVPQANLPESGAIVVRFRTHKGICIRTMMLSLRAASQLHIVMLSSS